MRIGRAYDGGDRLTGQVEIVCETAVAGDEALVFLALQRLADDAEVSFRKRFHLDPCGPLA